MSRVLATAATEPSVIRWLHALDPDRNLSGELLRSSVRYSTILGPAEKSLEGMPRETASLLIPMYRRGSLVLGQLYGPMSPNTMALALLCSPVAPPTPRSRRFVVDLASTKPIEFVEYEWFTDGKLAVSLHELTEDGVYTGQTIVFDGPPAPGSPVPSRVAMRLYYSEVPGPDRVSLAPGWRDRQSSWELWTMMFARLRSGTTRVTTRFAVPSGPAPDAPQYRGERSTNVVEECAIGECGFQMSSANKLVRMFLQAWGMNVSHPSQDQTVARRADRRAFTEVVTALYEDDEDDIIHEDAASSAMLVEPASAEPSDADIHDMEPPLQQMPMLGSGSRSGSGTVHPDVPGFASELQSPNNESSRYTPTTAPVLNIGPAGWSEKFPVSDLQSSISDLRNPPRGKPNIAGGTPTNTESQLSNGVFAPSPLIVGPASTDAAPPRAGGPSRKTARLHTCECGIQFVHRGHFNAHRRAVHEKIRPHRCTYRNCESSFAKKSDLLRHQLSQHSEEVRFECTQCAVSFPDKAQLALHYEAVHEQDRPYKCKSCTKSYSTRSGLRKHRHTKHPEQVVPGGMDDDGTDSSITGPSASNSFPLTPRISVPNGAEQRS